jgi:tRNA (cmo5U34)-methyltransferase
MENQCHSWWRQDVAQVFLDDVRGAFPLAAEQIDVLLRIIRRAIAKVDRLLDLGCGDGILGRTVMIEYPQSTGVFLDFSEHMIEAARQKTGSDRAVFVLQDLAAKAWTQPVSSHAPFDLVLSGFAIHHLLDERKRELYHEIFDLLKPGGLFLNLEHVAPGCHWADKAFDDLFVDALWSYDQRSGGTKTREVIAEQWDHRPDKTENILVPVELQCQWLRDIGFQDVDCFFKLLQLALFGGKKPR